MSGGERFDSRKPLNVLSSTKVDIKRDSGFTNGDKSKEDTSFVCINWIKGCCDQGAECNYFHHLPTPQEGARYSQNTMKDCFGRDRHAAHKDDMSGVGSFQDPGRTLYCVGFRKPVEGSQDDFERKLERAFNEYGEVERTNVIWKSNIAFIRYRFRFNAEIGREALLGQCISDDDVIDIRWARPDPNPAKRAANAKADHRAVLAAIAGASLPLPAGDAQAVVKRPKLTK